MYQQAITILLERILTVVCKDCGVDIMDRNERTLVSSAINSYVRNSNDSIFNEEQKKRIEEFHGKEMLQALANVYTACSELRNDMNHAGMRIGSKKATDIKKGISKMVTRTMELLGNTSGEKTKVLKEREKLLINLSNHPYSTWCESQKVAASVYGDVVDVPFPNIDESNDMDYINVLADQYFQEIQSKVINKDVTVHLMGELTFTFALLKRLQEKGIRCIASTSKRIVKEKVPGKKEEVIFAFKRSREYS